MSEETTDLLALLGTSSGEAMIQTEQADDVAAMTRSGTWLPRLQVCGNNTELVKEAKIPMGHFALITDKNTFVDLGKQVNFLAFAFRSKAMRFTGTPISVFDRNDLEYKKIQQDSNMPDSGCGWGPEFLVWVPAANSFGTVFCNNPTLRKVAPALLAIMKKGESNGQVQYGPAPATATSKYIKGEKFSWFGADFTPNTTPMAPPEDPEWLQKATEEITKFRNPPKSAVETEEVKDSGRSR